MPPCRLPYKDTAPFYNYVPAMSYMNGDKG